MRSCLLGAGVGRHMGVSISENAPVIKPKQRLFPRIY